MIIDESTKILGAETEDRKVLKNKKAVKILSDLFFYDEVPKHFFSVSYMYGEESIYPTKVTNALNLLIKKGLVEESGKKPRVISITKEGISFLTRNFSYFENKKRSDFALRSQGEVSMRRAETEMMLKSIGVLTTPPEKPSLSYFLEALKEKENLGIPPVSSLYGNELIGSREEFLNLLSSGIFYSSREFREYLSFSNEQESIHHARFTGILFFKEHLYIIYNTGNRLMKWQDEYEERLSEILKRKISETGWYGKYQDKKEKFPAVIFGSSPEMIVSLVLSAKGGHIDNPSKTFKGTTNWLFNLRHQIFSQFFFVTLSGKGVRTLQRIKSIKGKEEYLKRREEYFSRPEVKNRFIKNNITSTRIANEIAEGHVSERASLYFPVPDLYEIYNERIMYKDAFNTVTVISEKVYAKQIGRAIGEQTGRILGERGEVITSSLFSNQGFQIEKEGEVLSEKEFKRKAKEKISESLERKKRRKERTEIWQKKERYLVSLQTFVSGEVKERIKEKAKEEGVSVSEYVRKILEKETFS